MRWSTVHFCVTTKLHTKTCVCNIRFPHSNQLPTAMMWLMSHLRTTSCLTWWSVTLHIVHYFLYVKNFRHIFHPWFDVCCVMKIFTQNLKIELQPISLQILPPCCNSSLVVVIIWKDKYTFCTYLPLQTSILKLETADFSENLVTTYKNCSVVSQNTKVIMFTVMKTATLSIPLQKLWLIP